MKYTDKDLDTLFDNIYEYLSKLDAKITIIKEGLVCISDLLKKEDTCQEPAKPAAGPAAKNMLNGVPTAEKRGNEKKRNKERL